MGKDKFKQITKPAIFFPRYIQYTLSCFHFNEMIIVYLQYNSASNKNKRLIKERSSLFPSSFEVHSNRCDIGVDTCRHNREKERERENVRYKSPESQTFPLSIPQEPLSLPPIYWKKNARNHYFSHPRDRPPQTQATKTNDLCDAGTPTILQLSWSRRECVTMINLR